MFFPCSSNTQTTLTMTPIQDESSHYQVLSVDLNPDGDTAGSGSGGLCWSKSKASPDHFFIPKWQAFWKHHWGGGEIREDRKKACTREVMEVDRGCSKENRQLKVPLMLVSTGRVNHLITYSLFARGMLKLGFPFIAQDARSSYWYQYSHGDSILCD